MTIGKNQDPGPSSGRKFLQRKSTLDSHEVVTVESLYESPRLCCNFNRQEDIRVRRRYDSKDDRKRNQDSTIID